MIYLAVKENWYVKFSFLVNKARLQAKKKKKKKNKSDYNSDIFCLLLSYFEISRNELHKIEISAACLHKQKNKFLSANQMRD